MKNNNYYVVPKARIEAFRNLLSNMQMAIDEVFEENYLPVKISPKMMGRCQKAFHEAIGELTLERRMPPDLNEIF
ncbi:MAG: hypothetical protein NTX25_00180 [Proteobacteria bacterium]|nr:hypothetical protein [Pseudomonadota bacterium]